MIITREEIEQIFPSEESWQVYCHHLYYLGPYPATVEEAFEICMRKWTILATQSQLPDQVPGLRAALSNEPLHDGGTSTCGLCMLFHENLCAGCPIDAVGHTACHNTPYEQYEDAYSTSDGETAARLELHFLLTVRKKWRDGNDT